MFAARPHGHSRFTRERLWRAKSVMPALTSTFPLAVKAARHPPLDRKPFTSELFKSSVHVKRVPEHDYFHDQSERAELILLSLSVPLP
jgi:hypothetical protein